MPIASLQSGVFVGGERGGLRLDVPIIADRLKSLGYQTQAIGKWHLGYSRVEYTPRERGFDAFYGSYNYGKYYFSGASNYLNNCGTDFWHNEEKVMEAEGVYDTHLVVNKAVDVIFNHDIRKPLFLYLSTNAAHGQTAEQVTDAPERNLAKFPYIGDRNRTLLAGTVDALDESVGHVVKALYNRGMLSNTVIAFTCDNGGLPWGTFSNTGSNWPLRGVKGCPWEGGIRVPALVWSPFLGRNGEQGVVLSELAHVVDWLPTLYSAAGGKVSDLGAIDGVDLWPALSAPKHNVPTPWPRREFLVNVDTIFGVSAYRDGDHKLVSINENTQSAAKGALSDPDLQGHVPTPGRTMPGESASESVNRLDSLMTFSMTWEVLKKFNGGQLAVPTGWREQAAVKCSPETSPSVPGLAELREGYYLFDLASDPCELNNLAQEQPSMVAVISKKLEYYEAAAQPATKHVTDPRGLPEVNDCVWARWEDTMQTANRVCLCP